ncbi:MAG: hypothetical protein IPJ75_01675 [Ignavibacteriales bacterium]|nr:hypothetical protein [Ignavibacteriales bacterium]
MRGYNFVPVVTPRVVGGDPGILADARTGLFQPDLPVDTQKISDLLTGKIPTHNPFNEAYKLLFIAACGWYNKQLPFMFEPLNSYTELLLPDDLLIKIYEEVGYFKKDIPTLILKNNITGLEIDNRAATLASFALMMKAMEYDRSVLTKGFFRRYILLGMKELSRIGILKVST